jgi:hypothetical protein
LTPPSLLLLSVSASLSLPLSLLLSLSLVVTLPLLLPLSLLLPLLVLVSVPCSLRCSPPPPTGSAPSQQRAGARLSSSLLRLSRWRLVSQL